MHDYTPNACAKGRNSNLEPGIYVLSSGVMVLRGLRKRMPKLQTQRLRRACCNLW